MHRRPNVLFVIMDDQQAHSLEGFAGPRPQSPHCNALVQRGTSFRNAFVTTPICTPARAEVLTGCHSFHNDTPWFGHSINPALTLMPRHFQTHGYHTIHCGKWHNDGHPRDKGYDRVRRSMYQDWITDSPEHRHMQAYRENGQLIHGHSTELFTDALIEELDQAPADKPWFAYIGYYSPHDPFECPPPFDRYYEPDSVPLPENFMPQAPWDNGDMTIRDELLLPWPRTQQAIGQYRAQYWAMITHHDHHIGRLLAWLEKSGQTQNTIVVFTGDHGLAVGSHGLLGKENMYDHSCKIPWVMSGPGIAQGRFIDDLVSNCDIFPTLCSACGLAIPPSVLDGVDQSGYLREGTGLGREFVVHAFQSPGPQTKILRYTQRAIRTRDWKLMVYPLTYRCELYHLASDPLELVNLLEPWRMQPDPRWKYLPTMPPEQVVTTAAQLYEQLKQWQQANNDPALAQMPWASIMPQS